MRYIPDTKIGTLVERQERSKWMSRFNPIIREEAYPNGLFPNIPYVKNGVAIVLTNGKKPPVLVDGLVSVRQIRNGKYSSLVEISTIFHNIDLNFSVLSKNEPYRFDVIVKVNVRVTDPIAFLNSQINDVPEVLTQHFSPIIRRLLKQADILEYGSLDEAVLQKLVDSNNFNDRSGLDFIVKDVEVQPDVQAMEYVRQLTDHDLNTRIERQKADIIAESFSIKEKMKSEIVSQQIDNMREIINFVEELRGKGILSDAEAAENVKQWLKHNNALFTQSLIEKPGSYEVNKINEQAIGELYRDVQHG